MTDGIKQSASYTPSLHMRATLARARNISWNRVPLSESVMQRSFGDIIKAPLPTDMQAILARIAGEPLPASTV
jgi:hypothetical protein